MRALVSMLCLLQLLMSLSAYAEGDERIAVLELSNPAQLKKQEVQYLSDLLRRLASSELAQRFLVIDKANVLELLPPDRTLEECIGECAVQTGRLLQAAYIITGDIIRFGKALRVTIRLHDTKTGRLVASEVASGREVTDMESGIQEAGGRLLRRLIKGVTIGSAKGTRRRIGGQRSQVVGSSSKRVIVTLRSDPLGAAVVIDGVQKCAEGKLVCKVELTEGAHQMVMTKTDYFMRSGSITVTDDDDEVDWKLDPNFATLKVNTVPSTLTFTIDGEEHEGSYSQRITPQKLYKVVSSDRCFDTSGEEVSAGKPGEVIEVNLKPTPMYAMIDVSARNPQGEPIKADVIVDGKRLGTTPGQYRVSVCSKKLEVKKGDELEYTQALSLNYRGEVSKLVATLNSSLEQYPDDKGGSRRLKYTRILGGTFMFGGFVGLYMYDDLNSELDRDSRLRLILSSVSLMVVGFALSVDTLLTYGEREEARRKALKMRALAPTLAPTQNGMTFGLSGTF